MKILGIDPGEKSSGCVLWDSETNRILDKATLPNEEVILYLLRCALPFPTLAVDIVAVENVASYGMPVGAEVFETCRWTGEFRRTTKDLDIHYEAVSRKEVVLQHCGTCRAKDKNVRAALLERFGDREHGSTGKGTKKNPGILYGINSHLWSALAVAVCVGDQEKEKQKCRHG